MGGDINIKGPKWKKKQMNIKGPKWGKILILNDPNGGKINIKGPKLVRN